MHGLPASVQGGLSGALRTDKLDLYSAPRVVDRLKHRKTGFGAELVKLAKPWSQTGFDCRKFGHDQYDEARDPRSHRK